MDLGMAGRAIVCASSRGLGRACGQNVHLDDGSYPALV
jgi:hypothetical protein